jgi:Flp pilus assembly protein TadD
MNNLAVLLYFRSRYAEAAELFEQILPRWRKERGDNHPDVLTLMNNLGAAQRQAGDYAGAEPILRETLALRRQRMLLGASLVANGKLVEAEPLITVSLPVLQAQWGNDHPSTRRAMNLHARLARTGLTR